MNVLTLGTFDLLHPGHVRFLDGIKERGPCQLIVAVNTDEFAARFKRPPVMSFEERVEMLQAIPSVDVIVGNDGEDQGALIAQWAPCRIVHGDDWTGAAYMEQLGVTRPWLEEHGVEIRYVPYTPGVSTSDIIDRVIRAVTESEYEAGTIRGTPFRRAATSA